MITPRAARCAAPIVAALLLVACAPAVKRPAIPVTGEAAPTYAAFERQQRDKAMALAKEQRWHEAANHWQVLALLRPDVDEYGQRADDARSRSRQAAQERLQAATEARRRGNAEQASQLYLKALSADPGNATALQALRQIEMERAPRGSSMRPSRAVALAKPAREGMPPATASVPPAAERRELDYGVMLFHQGEHASSIRALEAYLRDAPQDELGRRTLAQASIQLGQQRLQQGRKEEAVALFEKAAAADAREAQSVRDTVVKLRKSLADEFYQQGLRVYGSNVRQAIDYWERSLRYDPDHPQAGVRLRQARQADKNLRAMESPPPRR